MPLTRSFRSIIHGTSYLTQRPLLYILKDKSPRDKAAGVLSIKAETDLKKGEYG